MFVWGEKKKPIMRIREWKEEDLRKRKGKGRGEDRKQGREAGGMREGGSSKQGKQN